MLLGLPGCNSQRNSHDRREASTGVCAPKEHVADVPGDEQRADDEPQHDPNRGAVDVRRSSSIRSHGGGSWQSRDVAGPTVERKQPTRREASVMRRIEPCEPKRGASGESINKRGHRRDRFFQHSSDVIYTSTEPVQESGGPGPNVLARPTPTPAKVSPDAPRGLRGLRRPDLDPPGRFPPSRAEGGATPARE